MNCSDSRLKITEFSKTVKYIEAFEKYPKKLVDLEGKETDESAIHNKIHLQNFNLAVPLNKRTINFFN